MRLTVAPPREDRTMRRLLPVVLLELIGAIAIAQPPKPPAFPAINPAVAKLSQTAADLGSPGVGIAFSEVKGMLVAGFEDGTLRVWKKADDKEFLSGDDKGQLLKADTRAVTGVCAGGGLVASGSTDGKVQVWNLPADRPVHSLSTSSAVRCVALSADGKLLASGGDDNAVQLWDTASGKPIRKLTGPTDWVLAVSFSTDGKFVAAGGHDGRLWLWETTGKKLVDVPAQAPAPPKTPVESNVVSALAFSPDGKQIALGGRDGKVYQFQVPDGKFIRPIAGHTGAITGLAYHPGNAALASSSKDRSLRLWNPQNGAPMKTLEGHAAWAEGVVFLEKGTRLASVGADRTVRLWVLTPPTPKKK
jgi:WD40 repeat protein